MRFPRKQNSDETYTTRSTLGALQRGWLANPLVALAINAGFRVLVRSFETQRDYPTTPRERSAH